MSSKIIEENAQNVLTFILNGEMIMLAKDRWYIIVKYYTIEKSSDGYTVWKNEEHFEKDIGSCGCIGIFNGSYKGCQNYCKDNKIVIKRKKVKIDNIK